MRNLKKFLALVLAMMMAFSLMVTANAATTGTQYPDVAGVDPAFEEAVDVLTGMGVYSGDNGNFKPAATITRAEVAALIYRLATGDVTDAQAGLYARYGNFPDVREDAWYAGYVGYCANAGYIKGRSDGTFDPSGEVTGYEVLAMILRAIGYDKNGEFTGATWQTEVSALSQQLGVLDNIKTTQYGGTLYLAARRDVVADLLFQADSKVNMVIYTPAFGYQPYGVDSSLIGSTKNQTLGQKIFGLTNTTRIVVGNQETGESSTIMGATGSGTFTYKDTAGTSTITATYTMYAYPGGLYKTASTSGAPSASDATSTGNVYYPSNIGLKLDLETGLELFGHKLYVWYDDGTGTASAPGSVRKTFAYYDRADSVIILDDGDTSTGGTTALAGAARAEGLTLNDSVHLSQSFSRIEDQSINDKTAKSFVASPEDLYVLIDNNSDKVVDVIIPLNIQTSKVTAVDNVNAVKTVQVPQMTTVPAFDTDTTTNWNSETTNNALIEQDALVGDSTKTLGDYEIGLRVNGTKYDDTISYWSATESSGYKHNHTFTVGTHEETALYRLSKLDNTVQGQVASFNDVEGIIILSDGTKLERSLFYHTVVGNNFYTTSTTAPTSISAEFQSWQQAGSDWKEGYTNGTYRFYLDADGKYVGAVRVQDLGFIYGTYMDYDQVTSSSSFNYYVTGVDLNGEIVKQQQVTKFNGNVVTGTDQLGIPYRDTYNATSSSQSVNGIGEGKYKGMTVNGTELDSTAASLSIIGVNQGNSSGTGNTNNGTTDYFADLTIRPGDVSLGAKATIPATDTVGAQNSYGSLYFTNNTKFILVSGYGTDSVKATVYNGIEGLLGNSSAVSIDFDQANSTINIPHIASLATMDEMTYFTKSNFVYAQSQGALSEQVNTIILPEAAVTWVGGSNLYYVGNPTATLWNGNVTGEKATQFTMYQDGEAVNIWVEGLSYEAAGANNSAADVAANSDTFWQLNATSKKTNTGETIYQAGNYNGTTFAVEQPYALPVAGDAGTSPAVYRTGNGNMAHVKYFATTYDSQVALVAGFLKNVGSAKIVNLNASSSPVITATGNSNGYVWPGITDLTTLNNAGSVAGSGAYASQDLYVSVVYDSANNVSLIYVCWDQNATT